MNSNTHKLKKQKSFFVNNPCPQIAIENWLEILNSQERNSIILEIREDILSKVFSQVEKIDRDDECAQFIIDCAYDAWKKILFIEFFNNDASKIDPLQDVNWISDKIPEPCAPDTWAANQIKVQKDKNIFIFGDNPPEASKISLGDDSSYIMQEDSDMLKNQYGDYSTTSKISLRPIEEIGEGEEGLLQPDEVFSDSLEEQAVTPSIFSFTKKCPRNSLPFMLKDEEVRERLLSQKPSIMYDDKLIVAQCRTIVRDMNRRKGSKSNDGSMFNKKSFGDEDSPKNLRTSIRRSILPPIYKK